MRLDHVGLNVADIAAAEAWYGTAFGLEREFAVRFDDYDLEIVMLLSPEHGHRIELLHRGGSQPGLRAANPAEAVLTQGFGHLAFLVADLDAAHARLVAHGAGVVSPPRDSPKTGVRMSYLRDPEGNLIELVERAGPT